METLSIKEFRKLYKCKSCLYYDASLGCVKQLTFDSCVSLFDDIFLTSEDLETEGLGDEMEGVETMEGQASV